jgi:hypothetical protein
MLENMAVLLFASGVVFAQTAPERTYAPCATPVLNVLGLLGRPILDVQGKPIMLAVPGRPRVTPVLNTQGRPILDAQGNPIMLAVPGRP